MLFKTYLVFGAGVCLWFAAASALGWKAPSLGMTGPGGGSSSYGPSGGYYIPGGRSSSGSGGWGGGK